MRVSRLYSDRSADFPPIDFVDGLNVVLAQIRLPENRTRDTHNLGKSMLGRLLDFGFLAGRDLNFFLFKYPDRFNSYTFFLEIELDDGSYVTVRRSVGIQSIITLIDSDLPARTDGDPPVFDPAEIIRLLHDEGDEGRLFRVPAW